MGTFYNGDGTTLALVTEDEAVTDKYEILKNKKWLLFGDSITAGGSYWQPITAIYNMQSISGGYAGGRQAGYANGAENCVLEHLTDIDTSIIPDIITIALGTNDYSGVLGGAPIGTLSDDPDTQTSEHYTFIGCYKKLIKWCWNTYGKTPIVLLTPFPRNGGNTANAVGKTLGDYAQAIRDIAQYYSYPVCDYFAKCTLPIGTLSDYDSGSYQYTIDGLHLNIGTGKYVSPVLMDVLANVLETVILHCDSATQIPDSFTLTDTTSKRAFVHLYPEGTTDRVVWASSDDSVVSVEGLVSYQWADVTAVSNGTANITATIGDGSIVKTFPVTVALQ